MGNLALIDMMQAGGGSLGGTLSSTNTRIAWPMRCNRNGNIAKAHFYCTGTPGVVEARIETVSKTTANVPPTGTLFDAAASVTLTPASGWNSATFPTPIAVTADTWLAFVLTYSSGAATSTRSWQSTLWGSSLYPRALYTTTGSAGYAVQSPIIGGMTYSEGDAVSYFGSIPSQFSYSNTGGNSAENGNQFVAPFTAPLVGVADASVAQDSTTDYAYVLYDSTGAQLQIDTFTGNGIDAVSNSQMQEKFFASPYMLQAGQTYYLLKRALSAKTVQVTSFTYPTQAIKEKLLGKFSGVNRSAGGAIGGASATLAYFLSPIIDTSGIVASSGASADDFDGGL